MTPGWIFALDAGAHAGAACAAEVAVSTAATIVTATTIERGLMAFVVPSAFGRQTSAGALSRPACRASAPPNPGPRGPRRGAARSCWWSRMPVGGPRRTAPRGGPADRPDPGAFG